MTRIVTQGAHELHMSANSVTGLCFVTNSIARKVSLCKSARSQITMSEMMQYISIFNINTHSYKLIAVTVFASQALTKL